MSGQGDTTAHWLTVKDTEFQGAAGDGQPALLVLDPAARTKDLADRFAAGRLAVAARVAHEVWVRALGRPGIDLGATVEAGGLADALIGQSGYVRALRHRYGDGAGFVSEFRISVSVGG
jgi:hypothetical protein